MERTALRSLALLAILAVMVVMLMGLACPRLRVVVLVNGQSMEPTIPYGSIVFLLPGVLVRHPLKAGTIIAFESPDGITVIHRIVGVRMDSHGIYYITQGDANPEPDPYKVRPSMVDGVYLFHIYPLDPNFIIAISTLILAILVIRRRFD